MPATLPQNQHAPDCETIRVGCMFAVRAVHAEFENINLVDRPDYTELVKKLSVLLRTGFPTPTTM